MRRATYPSTTWSSMTEPLAIQVLAALTQHHRLGTLPDLQGLAKSCHVSVTDVETALAALDDDGFVDRSELRVTIAGIAVGLRLRAAAVVDARLAA